MEQVTDDKKVHMNSLEAWEFIYDGGGMGMMRNYLIIFFVIALLRA